MARIGSRRMSRRKIPHMCVPQLWLEKLVGPAVATMPAKKRDVDSSDHAASGAEAKVARVSTVSSATANKVPEAENGSQDGEATAASGADTTSHAIAPKLLSITALLEIESLDAHAVCISKWASQMKSYVDKRLIDV